MNNRQARCNNCKEPIQHVTKQKSHQLATSGAFRAFTIDFKELGHMEPKTRPAKVGIPVPHWENKCQLVASKVTGAIGIE